MDGSGYKVRCKRVSVIAGRYLKEFLPSVDLEQSSKWIIPSLECVPVVSGVPYQHTVSFSIPFTRDLE